MIDETRSFFIVKISHTNSNINETSITKSIIRPNTTLPLFLRVFKIQKEIVYKFLCSKKK